LRDGRPAPVAIATGLSDDNFTEIVSGELQAGDQVIIAEGGGSATGQPRP
jgi:hypothetical protein